MNPFAPTRAPARACAQKIELSMKNLRPTKSGINIQALAIKSNPIIRFFRDESNGDRETSRESREE
jgi:hypothetical protein